MEARIILASACIGGLAIVLLGLFQNVFAGETSSILDRATQWKAQQALLSQSSQDNGPHDWNLFYHLGGNGPWIPKSRNITDDSIAPPPGCRVEQVHMVGLRC